MFAEEGVPVTPEIPEVVLAEANKEGELGEEDLETVSGGVNWYKIGKGVLLILEGIFS